MIKDKVENKREDTHHIPLPSTYAFTFRNYTLSNLTIDGFDGFSNYFVVFNGNDGRKKIITKANIMQIEFFERKDQ